MKIVCKTKYALFPEEGTLVRQNLIKSMIKTSKEMGISKTYLSRILKGERRIDYECLKELYNLTNKSPCLNLISVLLNLTERINAVEEVYINSNGQRQQILQGLEMLAEQAKIT